MNTSLKKVFIHVCHCSASANPILLHKKPEAMSSISLEKHCVCVCVCVTDFSADGSL